MIWENTGFQLTCFQSDSVGYTRNQQCAIELFTGCVWHRSKSPGKSIYDAFYFIRVNYAACWASPLGFHSISHGIQTSNAFIEQFRLSTEEMW